MAATAARAHPTKSHACLACHTRSFVTRSTCSSAASSRSRGTLTIVPHVGQVTSDPACPSPTGTVAEQRQGTRKILVVPGIESASEPSVGSFETIPTRPVAGRDSPAGFFYHSSRKNDGILVDRSEKNWPRGHPTGIMWSPPEVSLCRHVACIPPRFPGFCDGSFSSLRRGQVVTGGLAFPRGQRGGWTCLPLESHCRHPEGLFGGRSPHAGVSRNMNWSHC